MRACVEGGLTLGVEEENDPLVQAEAILDRVGLALAVLEGEERDLVAHLDGLRLLLLSCLLTRARASLPHALPALPVRRKIAVCVRTRQQSTLEAEPQQSRRGVVVDVLLHK